MMATGQSPQGLARPRAVAGGLAAAFLAAAASCVPAETAPAAVAEDLEAPRGAEVCGCGAVAVLEPRSRPWATWARKIEHGLRDEKVVALTFDACSDRRSSRYDERIVQLLASTRTPATIFIGGRWAEQGPEHLAQLVAQGDLLELGIHGYRHPHFTELGDEAVRDELRRANEVLTQLTGRVVRLFRPPYDESDDRVVRLAAEEGLATIGTDLPSGDADLAIPKDRLVEWVVREAEPGSIVTLHINHPEFHTADALPEIIDGLRARGLRFVTVGDLLYRARQVSGGAHVAAASP
jgi:peptidoglycan/xylan/chitin deacetylase (PgdA/CDA1 family)